MSPRPRYPQSGPVGETQDGEGLVTTAAHLALAGNGGGRPQREPMDRIEPPHLEFQVVAEHHAGQHHHMLP